MSGPCSWRRRVLWLPSTHTYLLSRRNTASRIIMYSISLRVLSSLLVSPRVSDCSRGEKKETRKKRFKAGRRTERVGKRWEGEREGGNDEGIRGLLVVPGYSAGPYTPTTISVTHGPWRWWGGQMLGLCNSGVALLPEQKKEREKKRRTLVGLEEKGILVFPSGSETLLR